ncbi:MAG: SH3 domain-containing protein [Lachnospiraceae bacterium]|nr:SH3 domain-containing protein [Lachnospiraceae bacterium]
MKRIIPILIAVALILIVGALYGGGQVLERYSYSREYADLNEYFGVTGDGDIPILMNNEWIDVHARMVDGGCYLRHEDVDRLLNSRFYYGRADGTLVYTTPDTIITAKLGTDEWTSAGGSSDSGREKHVIAREDGETLWILMDYVERYSDFTWALYEEPYRIRISTEWKDFEQSGITKNTSLRVLGGVKSEILRDLKKGERVAVLERMETWSRVRTDDGFTGYVENKRLSEPIKAEGVAPASKQMEYSHITRDRQIVLAWHQIAGAAGNDTLGPMIAATNAGQVNGLNTISPTWFSLADDQGGINSFASTGYVTEAHAAGLEVWGLVDNFTGEGDSTEVLKYAATRANLIANLMDQAAQYDLEGINVDFEGVPASSGEDFIEFIRELSIPCRKEGIVLSVDNYVPMGSLNDHYDRAEQGVVADYIIVMGYDEHYKGSPEAGSVASIGYVEDGIRRTVSEVPAERVIGGMPFYTRVWSTKGNEVDSSALDMKSSADWVAERGVKLAWDDETCQNYGEITDGDGTLRQVWMEDAESIRTKIAVMGTYKIAGVAGWRLGFETPDIWEVIATSLASVP